MRQNILTHRWVVYALERSNRPRDTVHTQSEAAGEPSREPRCPFCPGNEHMLPTILFELPLSGNDSWQTRIMPNKYPVFRPQEGTTEPNESIYLAVPNYGYHEIIIETPDHNRDPALMTPEEMETVIETYVRRYAHWYRTDNKIKSIVTFRNHGEKAGASLRHPHSQMIALGIVPEFIVRREEIAEAYFRRTNRCVLCDVMDTEMLDRRRLVYENTCFLAFVPFAAEVSFEVWIAPKRHSSNFGLICGHEKERLAAALQKVLHRYYDKLDDPDYNYVIHSYLKPESIIPHLHWYLQIRPRRTTPAGFEIGSEMHVNTSLPECDAELLRWSGA